MRIAILSDDYLPASTRNHARMLHELALEFGSRGHSVVVITSGNRAQESLMQFDELNGVEVWRFKTGPTRDVPKYKRAANESLLSWNAIRAIKSSGRSDLFDICVNYSPTIFFGPLASWLRRRGAYVYLILRDFFPQWVVDEGMLSKRSLITKCFRFFEALNYRAADTLAVQSPANISAFSQMTPYLHPRVDVLYNWSNGRFNGQNDSFGRDILEREGITGKIVLFYGGNIGHAQDMDNLIRLAKRLESDGRVHLLLVGQGDEFDYVMKKVTNNEAANVSILSSVTQEQYLSILKVVDVGVFSLASSHLAHNFPGKLLGYMAAGLPILGSVNRGNDVIELLNESGSGLVSVNGQDDEFYDNALKLLSCGGLRTEVGSSAKKLLTTIFSVENAADQILAASERKE